MAHVAIREGTVGACLAVVLAVSAWGCARPAATRCADGTICPQGLQCIDGRCISSRCGNGILDPGEVCDDGNNVSGDGCSWDCTSDERCGNALYDPGEECDCGDGTGQGPLPLGCAGPNDDSGGLCTTQCKLHCGDGIVNSEEDCDGAPPEGLYCVDFGYDTGVLGCSSFCTVVGGESCMSFGWRRLPAQTRANLRSIWGTGADNLYAVGWSGTMVRFDGRRWEEVIPGLYEEHFYAVWGRGEDDIFVGGNDGLILHFDGVEWREHARLHLPEERPPFDVSVDINALWGLPDSEHLVAVGDSGRVWSYDGETWTLDFIWHDAGRVIDLHDIWGTSYDNLYAVGDDFSLLHYDGESWSEVQTGLPTPPLGDDSLDDFNSVWGSSASDVYVVGDQGTLWHYDGERWSAPRLPHMYANGVFRAVWGTGPDHVFVAGADGSTLYFDGRRWIGLRATQSDHLYALWGVGPKDVYVVGNNGAVARHRGWAWAEIGPLTDRQGAPVQTDLLAAWGSSNEDIYVVGRGGLVLRHDGSDWAAIDLDDASGEPINVTRHLRAVWGTPDGAEVFIVGDNGTVLQRDDGVWRNNTIAAMGTRNFLGVWGTGAQDAYAVGQRGAVYRFGGLGWEAATGVPTQRNLHGVFSASPTDVYVLTEAVSSSSGSQILRFDGTSWSIDEFMNRDELRSVWGSSRENVYIAGDDGLLLRRDPQGGWEPLDSQTAQNLYSVAGNGRGELFTVGSNGTVVYHDGQNWQPVRINTFSRLNAVWGTDQVTVFVGRDGVLEMLVRTDR